MNVKMCLLVGHLMWVKTGEAMRPAKLPVKLSASPLWLPSFASSQEELSLLLNAKKRQMLVDSILGLFL